MKRTMIAAALLLASTALAALPAQADIVLDTHGLGGTGTNVVFNSFNDNLNLVLGTLNGQNNEVVRIKDLSGDANFIGSAGQSGNDIKLSNSSELDIQVFDFSNITRLGVTREIFGLLGTGTVGFTVTALETDGSTKVFGLADFGTFDLSLTKPSNFDFTAINGERIIDFDVKVVGGSITDFEHYRIDVNPVAVPGPVVGAGIPGAVAACFVLFALHRRRRSVVG